MHAHVYEANFFPLLKIRLFSIYGSLETNRYITNTQIRHQNEDVVHKFEEKLAKKEALVGYARGSSKQTHRRVSRKPRIRSSRKWKALLKKLPNTRTK